MALITAEEVIQTCVPDQNMDKGLFTAETISRAERKYIRTALGEDMYAAIDPKAQIYKDLMPYLKRALAWFVLYEAYPDIDIHTSAMGFNRNSVPGTEIIPTSRYALRRDAVFQTTEFERKEMKDFICDNRSDYPLYSPESDQNKTGAKPILY